MAVVVIGGTGETTHQENYHIGLTGNRRLLETVRQTGRKIVR